MPDEKVLYLAGMGCHHYLRVRTTLVGREIWGVGCGKQDTGIDSIDQLSSQGIDCAHFDPYAEFEVIATGRKLPFKARSKQRLT